VDPNYDFGDSIGDANVVTTTPSYLPLRFDAFWNDPAPPSQQASMKAVRAAGRRHHPVLLIPDYAPKKYASAAALRHARRASRQSGLPLCIGYNCAPRASAVGAYLHFAVTATRTCVRAEGSPEKCAVEPWNEPDLAQFWGPKPQPAVYGNFLARTCRAIHRRVSPQVMVVTGGVSATGEGFLTQVFQWLQQHHLSGCFNAVGFHPYGSDGLTLMAQVHRLMVKFGYGNLPIWATEVGLDTSTSPRQAPAAMQSFVRQCFIHPWCGRVYWYTWLADPNDGINGMMPNHNPPRAPGNSRMLQTFLNLAATHDRG
jgi:hypothetical protein